MKIKLLFCLGLAVFPTVFLCADTNEVAPGVVQLGQIQNASVTESSGVIPSHRRRGFFWTHNDGGDGVLYGITPAGAPAGEFNVKGASLDDWEDIAYSAGRIYIADIGNNNGNRDHSHVYAVREPRPGRTGEVRVARQWRLSYPGNPFNAESLVISRGYGYIIAKELNGGESSMYRFRLAHKSDVTLEKQCRLDVNALPAGADLTTDSKRLAVITSEGAYLFEFNRRIPVDGKIEPSLFVPFVHERMEGCCFTSEGLLVTAETGEIYLFTDPMFHLRWRAPKVR